MNLGLNYLANLSHYIPEALAVVTMVGLLFIEATYHEKEHGRAFVYFGALIGLALSFFALCSNLGDKPITIFTNALVIDPFSTLAKMVMVLGTLGAIYLSKDSRDVYDSLKSEFVIMSIGVLVGGMLLASANNLLTLYIGVETLSILSYVMASFKKNEERSSEAGLKYSLYGGVTSGLMLFGMSHIFGTLGTIQFVDIATKVGALSFDELTILLPSFLLFFAGIGYKIACVPFHMWSPDVYEGSPIPVTTFFAIVPKVAGIVAVVRVTSVFFAEPGTMQASWIGILQIIAALTMTVGNITAIGQRSVKRMLAYSSISHAGVMLMGVLVVNQLGYSSILFYAITYLFMTLVAFYIVSFVSDKYDNDHFDRFNGLIYRYPLMAILMAMVMFSLAGLPPLAGFIAKFNILSAVIKNGDYTIAVIAALNSVVSLYYYMKIVRLMILKEPDSKEQIEGFGFVNQTVIAALSVPVLVLGLFWDKILALANNSELIQLVVR